MTARVFVPLVGADGAGQQVFEALAGDTPPEPHPARLAPQISELHDFGLYRTGQLVREAVTRFTDARRERVWLGRRNARVRRWHLRISDLQVGRLSDENARSAGLGLALAALLQAFDRPEGVVFATGEILLPQAPGPVGPTAVGAVEGIRGKLSLVGDYILMHRAQLAGETVRVILPAASADGQPLEAAEARVLARLAEQAAAAGVSVQFQFIASLDDLEAVFGPFSAEPAVGRRGAAVGGGALALLGAAAGLYGWIVSSPVELSWRALDQAAAGEPAGPRRALYRPEDDRLELLPTCRDSQRQPVVVGGETLVLRVGAEDARPLAGLLAPARLFIASVSREADPIILDADLFSADRSTPEGALVEAVAAVPVEPAEDEVRLFVVATRDRTVSLSRLAEDLRGRLEGLDGAAVLASTAQFLDDRFDGQIDFQFRVTTDETLCPS